MADSEEICQGQGHGLFLPLFGPSENKWNNTLRVFLYLFGLLYCFMGVAATSDVFMAAIEKITSKKRRVLDKEMKKKVTVQMWNPTVANLTLMALGSSAPEILLNVIFIFADGYFQEGLGPSTIVGSAAFNLFCISAVCVVAIPAGEARYIKEMQVYCVTAFFSIFAYIWLLFILMVISPNIVEVWEGVLTFLFFPVLVTVAYLADRGYFTKSSQSNDKRGHVLSDDMSKEELAALEKSIRARHGGPQLTEQQVLWLIEAEYQAPRSRAMYRVGAIRGMTGGRRLERIRTMDSMYNVLPTVGTWDDRDDVSRKNLAVVEFMTHRYTVLESQSMFSLPVIRRGNVETTAIVSFRTREGSAKPAIDYGHVEGEVEFKPGETLKAIDIPIVDDSTFEQEEEFYVELFLEDTNATSTVLGEGFVTVVIIDDDLPGVLSFEASDITVQEATSDVRLPIRVQRKGGGSGRVTCRVSTEEMTAVNTLDFEPLDGEELVFEPGQMSATVEVVIKAKGRYENTEQFRVIIRDATGGATFDPSGDGGAECCITYVTIVADVSAKERIDKIMSALRVNWDRASLGTSNWCDQFRTALLVNGGDVDEDESIGISDYILHVINVPWKLLCALVPPTDFADGWACFGASLLLIGLVTAVIGDMAGLMGCCMFGPGNDGLTALTFVALGTSLPDTFASKTAAQHDPYADASIGNITGSNSVNVFLGLGLPWMAAAIYWAAAGPNAKWLTLYAHRDFAQDFLGGALVVEDPGLGSSVAVFTVCAFICMGVLLLRRKYCGGELGGPRPQAIATSCFFVLLWLTFVILYVVMK
mmetsp:Transcript_50674/g.147435  ORF Transcript_50674/g.147435 Transcript_50674/m.147435 type:complete len:815 (-) Transcript_50674:167-2611(-)